MSVWFFEVYTKDGNGRRGSDIDVGTIKNVDNRDQAVRCLRRSFGPKFDEIIQLHQIPEQKENELYSIQLDASVDDTDTYNWMVSAARAYKIGK
jgi:hypothetical protein